MFVIRTLDVLLQYIFKFSQDGADAPIPAQSAGLKAPTVHTDFDTGALRRRMDERPNFRPEHLQKFLTARSKNVPNAIFSRLFRGASDYTPLIGTIYQQSRLSTRSHKADGRRYFNQSGCPFCFVTWYSAFHAMEATRIGWLAAVTPDS
jgi:hypothetical protein